MLYYHYSKTFFYSFIYFIDYKVPKIAKTERVQIRLNFLSRKK